MKKYCLLWIILFSGITYADMLGGLGIGVLNHADISTWPDDTGYDDDDNLSYVFKAFTGYEFTNAVALHAGFMKWDYLKAKGKDATSTYEIQLFQQGFYLTPVFKIDPHWFIPIKLSAGMIYSEVELQVKESFFGLDPEGEVTITDNKLGFLLFLGLEMFKAKHVSGSLSFYYMEHDDFFEKSNKPFDVKRVGASFDLAFF